MLAPPLAPNSAMYCTLSSSNYVRCAHTMWLRNGAALCTLRWCGADAPCAQTQQLAAAGAFKRVCWGSGWSLGSRRCRLRRRRQQAEAECYKCAGSLALNTYVAPALLPQAAKLLVLLPAYCAVPSTAVRALRERRTLARAALLCTKNFLNSKHRARS